jgi:hypothetical protein
LAVVDVDTDVVGIDDVVAAVDAAVASSSILL